VGLAVFIPVLALCGPYLLLTVVVPGLFLCVRKSEEQISIQHFHLLSGPGRKYRRGRLCSDPASPSGPGARPRSPRVLKVFSEVKSYGTRGLR